MSGDLAVTDSLCWEKLYAEPFDLNLRAAVCVDLAKKNSKAVRRKHLTEQPQSHTIVLRMALLGSPIVATHIMRFIFTTF